MLTIQADSQERFCDGISRRGFLRIGSLGLGGLALPQWLHAEAQAGHGKTQKSVIMILLPGGPPQLDMFDMKPSAPIEIRGEFKPISSSVPGLQVCEGIPNTARICDELTIIRSMTHPFPVHCTAYVTSGIPEYTPALETRPRDPKHWPFIGSVVDYLHQRFARSEGAPAVGYIR